MAKDLGRHLAAVVVPFKDNLEIDEDGLRAVCRYCLAMPGIDGIVVNAHASELDTTLPQERVRLTQIAAEEAHKVRKTAISGVLPQPASYVTAVEMARAAEGAGADGILLLGPAGFGRGVELVPEVAEEYTRTVAKAISIPIIYFTAGALSGINYTPEVIRRIASVEGVVGVKDTMWSPQGFDTNLRMLRKLGRGTKVLSGNDNCVLYNFIAGADGSLLILHCAMGREICEMYDLVAKNDVHKAQEISERYEPLVQLLFAKPMLKMPTRMKHVLHLRGVIKNTLTRPPVPALTLAEAEALAQEVRRLDLRNAA